jgi:hypothetical protein
VVVDVVLGGVVGGVVGRVDIGDSCSVVAARAVLSFQITVLLRFTKSRAVLTFQSRDLEE